MTVRRWQLLTGMANRLLGRNQIPDTDAQKHVLVQFAEDYKKDCHKELDVFAGHAWDEIQPAV